MWVKSCSSVFFSFSLPLALLPQERHLLKPVFRVELGRTLESLVVIPIFSVTEDYRGSRGMKMVLMRWSDALVGLKVCFDEVVGAGESVE